MKIPFSIEVSSVVELQNLANAVLELHRFTARGTSTGRGCKKKLDALDNKEAYRLCMRIRSLTNALWEFRSAKLTRAGEGTA